GPAWRSCRWWFGVVVALFEGDDARLRGRWHPGFLLDGRSGALVGAPAPGALHGRLGVGAQLDQVAGGVADVDREGVAARAGPDRRPGLDGHAGCRELAGDGVQVVGVGD